MIYVFNQNARTSSDANNCSSCNSSIHSLNEQSVNATLAGINARYLQRMTIGFAEKGVNDSFLNQRHLKALLHEVILRKGLSADVLGKCDQIIAHVFSGKRKYLDFEVIPANSFIVIDYALDWNRISIHWRMEAL